MSKEIWEKHWASKETKAFIEWFEHLETYGRPTDFPNTEGEQDEYYTRRTFALMGWLGRERSRSCVTCKHGHKKLDTPPCDTCVSFRKDFWAWSPK